MPRDTDKQAMTPGNAEWLTVADLVRDLGELVSDDKAKYGVSTTHVNRIRRGTKRRPWQATKAGCES